MYLRCGENKKLSKGCRINSNNLKRKSCKSTGHVQKVCIKALINAISTMHRPKISMSKIKTFENTAIKMIADIYDNRVSDSAADAKRCFTPTKIENRYKNDAIKSLPYHVSTEKGYTLSRESIYNMKISRNSLNQQTFILWHTLKMYFNGSLWKKFDESLNIRIVYLIKI